MNRLSLSSVLLLAALGSTLGGVPGVASPAQAAPVAQTADGDSIQVVLNMTSMDLNTSRGWRDATRTIAETSHNICDRLLAQHTILPVDLSDCQENTTLGAMAQLDAVRQTQSRNHRSGHVVLAMSGQQ